MSDPPRADDPLLALVAVFAPERAERLLARLAEGQELARRARTAAAADRRTRLAALARVLVGCAPSLPAPSEIDARCRGERPRTIAALRATFGAAGPALAGGRRGQLLARLVRGLDGGSG